MMSDRKLFGIIGIAVVAMLGLIVAAGVASGRAVSAQCAEIMSAARTPRDTLDAKIACQKARDAANMRLTLGVAAGVIAGSMGGSK